MSYLVVFFRNQGTLGASIFLVAGLATWLFIPFKYLSPAPFFVLAAAWWFIIMGGFKVFGALRALHSVGGDHNALDKDGKPILPPGQNVKVVESVGVTLDPDAIDGEGNAALHRAVANSDIGAVRYLLGKGATVDIRNDKYQTPLIMAVRDYLLCKQEIVKELIAAGANVSAIDADSDTPLKIATILKNGSYVQQLIAAGADLNTSFGDRSALGYAAALSTFDIFKILLEAGAPIDSIDSYGDAPLHDAARKGNFRMVQALIDAGADPFATNAEGKTALDLATVPPVQMILREAMAKGA